MAACLCPFTDKEGKKFPCGKCPPCVQRRVNHWSFRLKKEMDRSVSAMFVTLTYNTDNVPITKNGFMTLDKSDVQKFFKRLRRFHELNKVYENIPVRYYLCGEYGGNRGRPHYHAILFNTTQQAVEASWKLENNSLGQPHYGDCSLASIGYTLKYMHKQSKAGKHNRDDRVPEFSMMSKRLGDNYLSPNKVAYHNAFPLERNFLVHDGFKISIPRYYKDKMFSDEVKEIVGEVSSILAYEGEERLVKELLKLHGDDWRAKYDEYIRSKIINSRKSAENERKAF